MNGLAALDGFISQNNISMNLSRIGNPLPAPDPEETPIDRYRCQISRGGKQINVYVAVPSEEERLTPSDVLFMLVLDASGCEMLKDYYGLHEQISISDTGEVPREFDDFWTEYRSRCEQSRKLKAFLGKNLFNELIIRFGFKD